MQGYYIIKVIKKVIKKQTFSVLLYHLQVKKMKLLTVEVIGTSIQSSLQTIIFLLFVQITVPPHNYFGFF